MFPTNNQSERKESLCAGSWPIRLAGATLGHRAHICAFFNSSEEAYRVLVPFVQEGLDRGEKAVHTVDPRLREEHIRQLISAGIDLATAHKNDQLELRDWSNTHLRSGKFDQHKTLALFQQVMKESKEKGFPLIRFITQMEWVLETELDLNDLLEYEARANEAWLLHDGPVHPVICTYDLRKFRGDVVMDVMKTHPLIIIGGILQENPLFVPPDKFLEHLRERRAPRASGVTGPPRARREIDEAGHAQLVKSPINDLAGLLALPAIWTGGEAPQIVTALIDVLLNTLQLDSVYVVLNGTAGTPPLEMIRSIGSQDAAAELELLLKEALEQALTCETWPFTMRRSFKEDSASLAAYRLGLTDELGVLVAASRRSDFPDPNERLLLNVAANQATIGLREASLRAEQRRLAEELDQRVAQRTKELEQRNTEVKKLRDDLLKENIALRKEIYNRGAAESALMRSEFYLAEGQRLAHTGSWGLHPSGRYDYWSEELFRIYGLDPAGGPPTLEQYLACVHPQDREFMAEAIRRMHEQHCGCDLKKRIIKPDGEVRYIRCVGIPVVDNQVLKGFVGTAMDVTEHEELTQQLRCRQAYLAEAQRLSHTGSFGWRVANGEISWSDETYRIFECGPDTKPTIELVLQRTHPEDRVKIQELISQVSQDERDFELEHRLLFPDGSVKNVHVVAHALSDELGSVEFVGAVMDVTHVRQANCALEKAFKEIEGLKDRLFKENIALREELDTASMFEEIVGASPQLQPVLSKMSRVAPTDSTVLITGETGTGKELVARAIHRRSDRASHAFVSVNCAAIPRDLVASELFGHEKGAFTGALQRRLGRFELAEGGTIFLDEVGELPGETQLTLLRVLQEHEFERVGGTRPIQANVRVIAATNRDLPAAIAAGNFRKDLFYRLNVFPIEVPPLRERKEDIPMLVEYFVDRYARKSGRKMNRVQKKTLDLLQAYSWPGNIRELQNVLERSVILSDTENLTIDENWLSLESSQVPRSSQPHLKLSVAQEKGIIERALEECRGRVSGPVGAAAKLGIPASTLESRIRSLRINKYSFKTE